MSKTLKKVYRVYFDSLEYVNPKEVNKIFKLYNEIVKLEKYTTERDELVADMKIICRVICPSSGGWEITECGSYNGKYSMIRFFTYVETSLIEGGQD